MTAADGTGEKMGDFKQPQRDLPKSLLAALIFGAAVAAAAWIGGVAASSAAAEYEALSQPPWAPPPEVFGPVWTGLYTLIAIPGWLVWRKSGTRAALTALILFGVQLLLNALWTPLFFGAGGFGLAFVDICLLLVAIVATIVAFWRHSRLAALLLLPYLAWVGFASALNWSIWQLNP